MSFVVGNLDRHECVCLEIWDLVVIITSAVVF